MENTILQRIISVRDNNNLNDSQFAQMIGFEQRTVSYYLKGLRKPSLEFVEAVIRTYGLDANELILGYKMDNVILSKPYRHKSENKIDYKEKYYEQLEEMNELRKRIDEFQAEEIERKNVQTGVGDVVAPARVG